MATKFRVYDVTSPYDEYRVGSFFYSWHAAYRYAMTLATNALLEYDDHHRVEFASDSDTVYVLNEYGQFSKLLQIRES